MARLEEFPHEKWALMVQVMLTGVADLTRGVLSMMRSQGYGRIINIGSIHSVVASPFKSAYVAAKHGLIGFSKVIALETADVDVTINTICPSYVKTPLVDAQIANQAKVIQCMHWIGGWYAAVDFYISNLVHTQLPRSNSPTASRRRR